MTNKELQELLAEYPEDFEIMKMIGDKVIPISEGDIIDFSELDTYDADGEPLPNYYNKMLVIN